MSATIDSIAVTECRRLLDGGQTLHILDVRTPAEFARVHAAGARSLPLDKLDPAAMAALRRQGNEPIYVICQSGKRGAMACQRLRDAGLDLVYNIEGGTAAWEQSGLPVTRGGGKVISLERQVRISAGFLVLLGVTLAWTIHWGFLAIPAFVGAGLMFAGATGFCTMAKVLAFMPWNRVRPA